MSTTKETAAERFKRRMSAYGSKPLPFCDHCAMTINGTPTIVTKTACGSRMVVHSHCARLAEVRQ